MKNLIEKFKEQPAPLKMIISILILWVYPFIYAMVIGATGWNDLNVISLVLMGISAIPFGYMTWQYGLRPVIYWIGLLFKKK